MNREILWVNLSMEFTHNWIEQAHHRVPAKTKGQLKSENKAAQFSTTWTGPDVVCLLLVGVAEN